MSGYACVDAKRARLEYEARHEHGLERETTERLYYLYQPVAGLETVDDISRAVGTFDLLVSTDEARARAMRRERRARARLDSFTRRMSDIETALDRLERGPECVFGCGRKAVIDRLFCAEHADMWCHACGLHATHMTGGLPYCPDHPAQSGRKD